MVLWQQGIVDLLSVIKVQLLSQRGAINSASGAVKGCKSNKTLLLIFILACWLQSWHPGDCYNVGYPSKMHLKLKLSEISLIHYLLLRCPIILKFCIENGSTTAVQIFKTIWQLKWMFWKNENLWHLSLRWVWDGSYMATNPLLIWLTFSKMLTIRTLWLVSEGEVWGVFCELTHWGRDKMAVVLQTTLSFTSSWMKMLEFRWRFHWSLFLRVQLTIFQHWFR